MQRVFASSLAKRGLFAGDILNVNSGMQITKWTKSRCKEEIKKYEYKTDFIKKSPGAYLACKKNGWHLERISKLKVKLNRHWTKEQIIALASKCNSRKEFTQEHKGAYLFALRRGWKDEVLKNLPISFKYWDFKSCQKEAKKYNTKKEFRENCGSAYAHASENKFLNEICLHMEVLGSEFKRMIYAYEFSDGCAYVGLTYNEKKRQYEHFYEKRGPVAKHIAKSGLTPKYLKLHDYVSKEKAVELEEKYIKKYREMGWRMLNGIKGGALGGNERNWTFEKCLEEAKKFNKKADLANAPGLGGLWNAARKNGWWDQICSHMTGGNTKWSKQKVLQAARSSKYVGEFQKNYAAAYRAAKVGGYLNEVQAFLKKKLRYWNENSVAEEAKKYNTIASFQKGNPGAYNYAMRNEILEQVSGHMKKLTYWSFEKCKKEAKKYTRKLDFMKQSASCYQFAKQHGFLDQICSTMEQKIRWSENRCREEARKYTSIKEFNKKGRGAYGYARRKGILDSICSHMA